MEIFRENLIMESERVGILKKEEKRYVTSVHVDYGAKRNSEREANWCRTASERLKFPSNNR